MAGANGILKSVALLILDEIQGGVLDRIMRGAIFLELFPKSRKYYSKLEKKFRF